MNEENSRYRKISPIYNALDDGNYKGAIKLCQRKEIQNWDIAKAMHGYSLVMLHKHSEGLALAREVKANNPVDEDVLNILTLTFKNARCDEEASECYENALKAYPDNETYGIELFVCYVRMGQFKKMQQLAQKLYKLTAKRKYIFWAVSSMLHQSDLPTTMIELSEKMLLKALSERSSITSITDEPGAEEILLLVDVYERRAKLTSINTNDARIALQLKALEALSSYVPSQCATYEQESSTLSSEFVIEDDSTFKGDPALVKSNKLQISLTKLKVLSLLHSYGWTDTDSLEVKILFDILEELPDQWSAWDKLILCNAKKASNAESSQNHDLIHLHTYIKSVQQKHSQLRAPLLSEIFLVKTLWTLGYRNAIQSVRESILQSNSSDDSSELTIMIENMSISCLAPPDEELLHYVAIMNILLCRYLSRFDSKQCCFSDLRTYLFSLGNTINSVADSNGKGLVLSLFQNHFLAWLSHRIIKLREELLSLLDNHKNSNEDLNASGLSIYAINTLITRLSKNFQVLFFVSILLNVSDMSFYLNMSSQLLILYQRCVGTVGCGAGVGGLREVQPSDELLLLNNSVWKYLYSCGGGQYSPQIDVAEESSFVKNFKQSQIMIYGRKNSPYNYGFKLELLDPIRSLACGQYALDAFNSLEIKYIQLDSMTYLIIPALYESGYYLELRQLYSNIINFHATVPRDTNEMVSRSFKFSNYVKGLELGQLTSKCQKSTQLALARAELPILEILERIDTLNVSKATSYLQEYIFGMLPESQSELSMEEVNALVDNMDYGLLISADDTNEYLPSESGNRVDTGLRRQQYISRIHISQNVTRLILNMLQNDHSNSRQRINSIWRSVTSSVDSDIDAVTSQFRSKILSEAESEKEMSISFSQHINCGEISFDTLLYEGLLKICSLCIHSQSASTTSEESTVLENDSITRIKDSILVIIQDISSSLGLNGDIPTSKYLKSLQSKESCVKHPLRPQWIQRVSAMLAVFGNWVPLLLNHYTKSALSSNDKKNKKGKKGNTVASVDIHHPLKDVVVVCKRLLETLQTSLGHEIQDDVRTPETIMQYVNSSENANDVHAAVVNGTSYGCQVDKELLDESEMLLAKALISSQQLSCLRLRKIVQNKLQLFDFVK